MKACRDYADAIGDVAKRCGGDYQETYDRLAKDPIYGCTRTDGLRDEASFYDDCLPFIEAITCDQYFSADTITYPFSCDDQLIYLPH